VLPQTIAVGSETRWPSHPPRTANSEASVYGVWGPPTAYLIDRQGRLVGRIQGARDWSTPAARNLLRSLVEETSP
jgi:hypothetical protein